MPIFRFGAWLLVAVAHAPMLFSTQALTLEELQADAKLTPATFLAHFSDFGFKLRGNTQSPELFLSSKAGDCDDFANLAAIVLKARGYTPRIVVVSLERVTHVVCYLPETHSYLDYNHRHDRVLVPSDGTLPNIAQSVASSFKSNWYSVSEVTFNSGIRRFIRTEFQ